ncbi:MAG: nitroreductase family protein [Gemmatimonadaceae bacterium]
MNILEAFSQRRSIKRFQERLVTRTEIEALLDAAVLAPNHRLTQPWRFYVLGPQSRAGYGFALGDRKARKVEDPAAAQVVRERTANEYRQLPAMIAVAMVMQENLEQREEDYAAVMMAVQNLLLAAVAAGLGTHVRTGAVMDDPAARAAMGIRDAERVVATISLGAPEEVPPARARQAASLLTTWVE